MKRLRFKFTMASLLIAGVCLLPSVDAMIMTVKPDLMTGEFHLTTGEGYISTPDGGSYYAWGYAVDHGMGMMTMMQYPGPTLEVIEGDTVTVVLNNMLPVPVSMVFPGQESVTATGGTAGLLTQEVDALMDPMMPPAPVTYTFVATHPGTYLYHSGTQPELQIEMGLVGALIVRPAMQPMGEMWAYNHMDSRYDYETLYLLTEMDPKIHEMAECGMWDQIDMNAYWPVLWFINGRNAPDTMLADHDPLLPYQPYSCMPRMHPGDRMLMRFVGGGRDLHPFHTHGNNMLQIARDGRLLSSMAGAGADLAESDFTLTVAPGQTADSIFEWTGEKLGWDIYGHAPGDPMEPGEYAPDHGKPFPVTLPDVKSITLGAMYSGSPFLGAMGALPPGEGGFNINGGYFYMWHSHNEKEMVNNDLFPGGLMTMLLIEPPSIMIDEMAMP